MLCTLGHWGAPKEKTGGQVFAAGSRASTGLAPRTHLPHLTGSCFAAGPSGTWGRLGWGATWGPPLKAGAAVSTPVCVWKRHTRDTAGWPVQSRRPLLPSPAGILVTVGAARLNLHPEIQRKMGFHCVCRRVSVGCRPRGCAFVSTKERF